MSDPITYPKDNTLLREEFTKMLKGRQESVEMVKKIFGFKEQHTENKLILEELKQMELVLIHNHVLFQFLEDVAGGTFARKTKSGITIASLAGSRGGDEGEARWAKVIARGPDCSSLIEVGKYILIESKMWTTGFRLQDQGYYWKTDDTKVVAVSDEPIDRY